MRFVTEKHRELITSVNDLVNFLVGEDLSAKKSKATFTLAKARELQASVSKQDCPEWLTLLILWLSNFSSNSWTQTQLINHLITKIDQVRNHKWIFENPSQASFNFDAIFEHYKSQSKLSELFDEIIKILEGIQGSGEVDSVSMMTALGKVIATLKKNKDGSYLSINSAWAFLVSFLQNYMWAELSKVPVLGTAMDALRETIEKTGEEIFKVHNEVQTEMEKRVEAEVEGLKGKTDFQFIGYDKSGMHLPRIPHSPSVNETA